MIQVCISKGSVSIVYTLAYSSMKNEIISAYGSKLILRWLKSVRSKAIEIDVELQLNHIQVCCKANATNAVALDLAPGASCWPLSPPVTWSMGRRRSVWFPTASEQLGYLCPFSPLIKWSVEEEDVGCPRAPEPLGWLGFFLGQANLNWLRPLCREEPFEWAAHLMNRPDLWHLHDVAAARVRPVVSLSLLCHQSDVGVGLHVAMCWLWLCFCWPICFLFNY